LGISRLSNQLADAAINAAEGWGSDGRGRDGLRGYMLFLAGKYPVQFLTWLVKMERAQLSKRPRRRSRTGGGFSTPEHQTAIKEALVGTLERLGSDGKGRGGATGYLVSLGVGRPKQYARLIKLLIDIQESEKSSPQYACEEMRFTEEEIRKMTLAEKKAKLNEILAAHREKH
jgi:hypothetical protein